MREPNLMKMMEFMTLDTFYLMHERSETIFDAVYTSLIIEKLSEGGGEIT